MKTKKMRLAAAFLSGLFAVQTGPAALALSAFDAEFYAAPYPDVAAVCGNDESALLMHYIRNGAAEGRLPCAGGIAGDTTLDLTDEQIHELAFKCSFEDTRTIGVFKQLNMKDMEKIYAMAR